MYMYRAKNNSHFPCISLDGQTKYQARHIQMYRWPIYVIQIGKNGQQAFFFLLSQ